ncbi:MAG: hypothetical protein ACYC8S_02435 [Minisyncoccota bacterium]
MITSLFPNTTPDELSAVASILSAYSFWSFLIIAVVTTALVFVTASRMRGGLFSKVLIYFGCAMTLIFFGGLLAGMPTGDGAGYPKLVHDSLFIISYILMALGANKLYSFTQSTQSP